MHKRAPRTRSGPLSAARDAAAGQAESRAAVTAAAVELSPPAGVAARPGHVTHLGHAHRLRPLAREQERRLGDVGSEVIVCRAGGRVHHSGAGRGQPGCRSSGPAGNSALGGPATPPGSGGERDATCTEGHDPQQRRADGGAAVEREQPSWTATRVRASATAVLRSDYAYASLVTNRRHRHATPPCHPVVGVSTRLMSCSRGTPCLKMGSSQGACWATTVNPADVYRASAAGSPMAQCR